MWALSLWEGCGGGAVDSDAVEGWAGEGLVDGRSVVSGEEGLVDGLLVSSSGTGVSRESCEAR